MDLSTIRAEKIHLQRNEAAINGRADALVTYNVADFAGPAERFRISVLRPGELLKKVKP